MINNRIIDNYNYEENTFCYFYKYKSYFDKSLCLELINLIVKDFFLLNFKIYKNDFLYLIFDVYSSLNIHLVLHLDNHPIETITNYDDSVVDYLFRFREIIKLIINEDKEGLLNYEDDLGKLNLS